jgi:hypothetical protein
MRRLARRFAPGATLALFMLLLGAGVLSAQPAPPAPAPPAPAAPPVPPVPSAGSPLRAQVEARFEVLPVSDGLLLRPKGPMNGVRTLEIRDGELAIDGREAEADELEKRIGAAAAAPVRALLELDPDELEQMFGLATAAPEPPGVPDDATMTDRTQELERRRAEIEKQQEEIRKRIEEEMSRHADDVQRRQEDLARELEKIGHRGGHRHSSDARVVMGTPVHVQKDESTGDVIDIAGHVTIEGEVLGDSVAVGGSQMIDGTVEGNVVAVGGSVHLGSNARVMGDVVSVGGGVDREPGAEVMGRVTEVSMWQGLGGSMAIPWVLGRHGTELGGGYFDGALLRFLRCIVFFVVLLLIGSLIAVIGKHPVERVSAAVSDEPWKAGVVGLLAVLLFLPAIAIVAVLLAVSIIGIPLLLLWPFAVIGCVFAAFFGYFASAHALAGWSERRFGWKVAGPVATMVLGLLLLHGPWLMARLIDVVDSSRNFAGFLRVMLLLFWMIVNLCAAFLGIGGVILARRRGTAPAPPAVAPLPPVPSAPGPPMPPSRVQQVSSPPSVAEASAPAQDWEPFESFDEPEPGTDVETRAGVEPPSPAEEPPADEESEERRGA